MEQKKQKTTLTDVLVWLWIAAWTIACFVAFLYYDPTTSQFN